MAHTSPTDVVPVENGIAYEIPNHATARYKHPESQETYLFEFSYAGIWSPEYNDYLAEGSPIMVRHPENYQGLVPYEEATSLNVPFIGDDGMLYEHVFTLERFIHEPSGEVLIEYPIPSTDSLI